MICTPDLTLQFNDINNLLKHWYLSSTRRCNLGVGVLDAWSQWKHAQINYAQGYKHSTCSFLRAIETCYIPSWDEYLYGMTASCVLRGLPFSCDRALWYQGTETSFMAAQLQVVVPFWNGTNLGWSLVSMLQVIGLTDTCTVLMLWLAVKLCSPTNAEAGWEGLMMRNATPFVRHCEGLFWFSRARLRGRRD